MGFLNNPNLSSENFWLDAGGRSSENSIFGELVIGQRRPTISIRIR